ncbi:MAG TPA: adenylate/guanylate cyclase domain-containing protein [Chloroflexota bacterium]|nr:adenylate/guanylate cyclase domain-containing protein [Chloroflexota bacterium]
MIISERQRATLLSAVFALMVLVFGASLIFIPEGSPLVPRGIRPAIIFLGTAVLAYTLALRRVINRHMRTGRPPPLLLRSIGALVETSIPTIAIVLAAGLGSPAFAILGPPGWFYFIFITLSTLRLSFWLSAVTGAIAAAEYLAAVFYYLSDDSLVSLPGDLTAPAPYFTRAIFLLAGGLVAGFVSSRIRAQILNSFHSLEERNRVVNMFGQHVSPAVVERLLQQDVEVRGEVRNVCVMFLDIRDFTAFSETREPVEVVDYLNSLFLFMIDGVNRHHGIVNKFLGDGFMAIFGAPISSDEDRQNAVRAAREIVDEVHARTQDGSIPPTRIGIGLHAGKVVTGNVGSEQRKEYTIIGDVVNLASRIEQLNKQFGSELLVSEAVLGSAPELRDGSVDIGDVHVKGRGEPVRVYRLI